jgi:hypothetical protein
VHVVWYAYKTPIAGSPPKRPEETSCDRTEREAPWIHGSRPLSRDELTATLFAIQDIREDVQGIRELLEDEEDGEAPEDDA